MRAPRTLVEGGGKEEEAVAMIVVASGHTLLLARCMQRRFERSPS